MPDLEPLDPSFPISRQMDIDASPIVLVNLCTMASEDEAAFLDAWAGDAAFMKSQPGFISTQLHRALGDSPTYLNYAVFESAAAWRGLQASGIQGEGEGASGVDGRKAASLSKGRRAEPVHRVT
ncbi:heme-degrading monooxygenase HmoA [Variovorax boronicumulans]|nr:heme-degrading monooxygenase HmoA [Variovorax boronicumulans]